MISSMQKNKKWLLPTIWISTIAFVGAGFVGWGSYSPTSSTSAIATVGKKEIPMNDLQQEYGNLYAQYQNMLGQQFNKEMAEQFNLEKMAYNNVVQRYLMLNLGEDLGLQVSDKEVFKQLVTISSFLKDGEFDNVTYKSILKQNQTSPKEFEEQIRKELTIKKIQSIFSDEANENTVKNLNKLFYAQDKIEINILSDKDIEVTYEESDLTAFYEKNKENYKSIEKFEVNVEKIKITDNEKESKNIALKKYLKLKKAKDTFTSREMIDKTITYLSVEEQNSIFNSELGSVLKPIRVNDDFVIYQLLKKVAPTALAYNEVKDKIKTDYISSQKAKLLNDKKDLLVKNFIGTDIGYINKETLPSINTLNSDEISNLVQKVFASNTIIDYVQLDNKIVVFKIIDTKLASYDKQKDASVKENISNLKNTQILTSIVEKLNTKYEIKSNYKVN